VNAVNMRNENKSNNLKTKKKDLKKALATILTKKLYVLNSFKMMK